VIDNWVIPAGEDFRTQDLGFDPQDRKGFKTPDLVVQDMVVSNDDDLDLETMNVTKGSSKAKEVVRENWVTAVMEDTTHDLDVEDTETPEAHDLDLKGTKVTKSSSSAQGKAGVVHTGASWISQDRSLRPPLGSNTNYSRAGHDSRQGMIVASSYRFARPGMI